MLTSQVTVSSCSTQRMLSDININELARTKWCIQLDGAPRSYGFTLTIDEPVKVFWISSDQEIGKSEVFTTPPPPPPLPHVFVTPAAFNPIDVSRYAHFGGEECRVRLGGFDTRLAFAAHIANPVEIKRIDSASDQQREAAPRKLAVAGKRTRALVDVDDDAADTSIVFARAKRPKIVGRACEHCHQRRKGCNSYTPCNECVRRGVATECVRHVRKNAASITREQGRQQLEDVEAVDVDAMDVDGYASGVVDEPSRILAYSPETASTNDNPSDHHDESVTPRKLNFSDDDDDDDEEETSHCA